MKALYRRISRLLDRFLFFLMYAVCRRRRPGQITNRMLLVHFGHIGDFVLWLNSAQALREIYRDKKLVLLLWRYADCSPIAHASRLFDEIIVVDTGWKYRVRSLWKLTQDAYDTVVNVRPTRNMQTDLFVLAPRAFERVAPASDLTEMDAHALRRSDRLYTRIIPCDGIKTMELIRNAQFVRSLGAPSFRASVPRLPSMGGVEFQEYFVICPGADHPLKRWPAKYFAEAADKMIEETGMQCILAGTAAEQTLVEQVIAYSTHKKKMHSLAGQTNLAEYIEVIRHASWVLSSDTSAAHIGAATGTPTLVVASGWDWGRFFPYQTEDGMKKGVLCPKPELACLGCGQNPAVTGRRACIVNGTMKCVQTVRPKDILSLWEELMNREVIS